MSCEIVSKLERISVLADLIEKHCEESDFINRIKLAKDLANVIDELNFFKIDLSKLTEEFFYLFPKHWKKRSQFLLIVTKYWSEFLEKQKKQDVSFSINPQLDRVINYKTPSPMVDIVKNKNISIIETMNIYEEIEYLIDIISKHKDKKVSIISPNPDFSKYLISNLNLKNIDYVSYVTNEKIPNEFIEEVKANFQNVSEEDFKKLTKELSEFAEIEKKPSNLSILNIKDISKINSEIIIFTELNELYWKSQESGHFWLHNSLRKKLNLNLDSSYIENLFYIGIEKHTDAYLMRSQKSNGQNIKKSSILAKFEAIAKKEKLNFNVDQFQKTKSISNVENLDISIKSDLFRFPLDISIRSLELLIKDPYAFYIKEILNLKPAEFDKEKNNLSIAFKNVIRCYFEDKSNLKSWLNLIKETDFFGYQKSLNILSFLDKLNKNPNSKNNILGKIKIPRFGINIYGYCDRIEEEKNSSTLIRYQTSSNQSIRDIIYGESITLLSICLIAEKQGFPEIKKPIRRIQIWNILSLEDDLVISKDIEISEELIMEFENRLFSKLDGYFDLQNEKINCKSPQKQLYNKYKHFKRN